MFNRHSAVFVVIVALSLLLGLTCCTNDSYKTGDSDLSYLHADFVVARTATAQQVVEAVNDDGELLSFDEPYECKWATEANNTYRALLYYTFNKLEDKAPHAVSLINVPVLTPKPLAEGEPVGNDPVGFESMWLSKAQPYLNLSILLKTGTADGLDSKQIVGIVKNHVEDNTDGTQTHHMSFYHRQNGVPEYYTTRLYVSIPTADYHSGDTVVLTIYTYIGVVERRIVL